jgi:PPM family protein phosphatase
MRGWAAPMSSLAEDFLDESAILCDGLALQAGNFLVRGGQLSVSTCRGPHKDAPGEDAVGLFRVGDHAWVLAVADGVGGAAGGRAAALATLAALGESLAAIGGDPQRMRSAILDGIEAGNRAVLALGSGAATTLAVAEITQGSVRSYHVGDSSVVLVGQRGRVKLQTVPHSPVGFAVEAGLLDADEAIHHELLHVISNVVGSAEMRIEIGPEFALADRDTLLLASDGLFDNMRIGEIVETIRCGPLPAALAGLRRTVDLRMRGERGPDTPSKPDDCSIVLFRRHSPASAHSWFRHEPGTRDWLGSPVGPGAS